MTALSGDSKAPFWRTTSLEDMTHEQWESLCDGCARCCIHRLEDEDTGEVHETIVACRLLDVGACRCTSYERRHKEVPGCAVLTPAGALAMTWLPDTCAYRRVALGRDLPDWHHLKTGDPESVHEAKASVRGRVLSELLVGSDDLEDLIIDFDELAAAHKRDE